MANPPGVHETDLRFPGEKRRQTDIGNWCFRDDKMRAELVDLDAEDLRQDPAVLEEVVCGGRWVLGCVRERALSRQPRDTAHRVYDRRRRIPVRHNTADCTKSSVRTVA